MESIKEITRTKKRIRIVPVEPSSEWTRLKAVFPRNPPASIKSGDCRLREESKAQQEIIAPLTPRVT